MLDVETFLVRKPLPAVKRKAALRIKLFVEELVTGRLVVWDLGLTGEGRRRDYCN